MTTGSSVTHGCVFFLCYEFYLALLTAAHPCRTYKLAFCCFECILLLICAHSGNDNEEYRPRVEYLMTLLQGCCTCLAYSTAVINNQENKINIRTPTAAMRVLCFYSTEFLQSASDFTTRASWQALVSCLGQGPCFSKITYMVTVCKYYKGLIDDSTVGYCAFLAFPFMANLGSIPASDIFFYFK
jgi:hypothetical protein